MAGTAAFPTEEPAEPERAGAEQAARARGGTLAGRTMLGIAAESVAGVSGAAETVVDILHRGGFRHHTEGLRQYLAIRLGDADKAGAALDELRTLAATLGPDLLTPPGIRARLYRMARELAAQRRQGAPTADRETRARLPWATVEGADSALLQKLRVELDEGHAEILEMRHARELDLDEAAFALDQPTSEVEAAYFDALESARTLLGVEAADLADRAERLLLEAFALLPAVKSHSLSSGQRAGGEALPVGSILGKRYAIRSQEGSGTFAHVYRAEDTEVPGHVVAVKLLHQASISEETKSAALRELHLIASVFHPSVVQFKDHGWHEGRLWFVMPWYDGESLETRMDRAPLRRVEARRIFEPLARALATMHAAGIRHQDVKPDNIFLANIRSALRFDNTLAGPASRAAARRGDEKDVLPVLLDLGVAAKEAEMIIAGTPNYFAPEVAARFALLDGVHEVGTKADVFSLALSLRNALDPKTREEVVAGAVEAFIKHRAVHAPPLPQGKDLAYLRPVFERWLAKDPALRPTADEFAEELAVLTSPEEKREKRVSLLRWLVPSLVSLIAVFVAVVYFLGARAAKERLAAERARMTAATLEQNLAESREERESLESDVQALQKQYEAGRLTREELVHKLAGAEGQARALRENAAANEKKARAFADDLAKTQADLGAAHATLDGTKIELSTTRAKLTGIDADLAAARAELGQTRDEAEQARRDAADVKSQLGNLRAALSAEKARTEKLTDSLSALSAEKERMEVQLADPRRKGTGKGHGASGGTNGGAAASPRAPGDGSGSTNGAGKDEGAP